ncbi:hypothetical protein HJFPF1_07875 [Paramyrothecium foliicola]|nr:hypothetical protein HJFPF1_07875 [Paramyrothecium foliicola]
MPAFRGINMSISAEPGPSDLPELPHPETALVWNASQGIPAFSRGAQIATVDEDQARPAVSVYLPFSPGLSGTRFWIRYSIDNNSSPTGYLYFSAFADGRNTVNWGVDLAVSSTGSIGCLLREPGDQWHFEESGNLLRRAGVESGCFRFATGPGPGGTVNDGKGLLEVRVFRALGRRRTAPVLTRTATLNENEKESIL